MKDKLNGTVIPLVTPVRTDHSVCEESVRRLIESVAPWAAALLPCLSSGEGAKMSCRQWQDMVTYALRHSGGLPVFPGLLVDATDDLLSRASFAAAAGAAGVTVAVPPTGGDGAAPVVDSFTRLLARLPLPVFLYNLESEGDSSRMLDILKSFCRMDKVVAIKESSRRPEIAAGLLDEETGTAIFQGWEDLCYQSREADGNALALSNLEPKVCSDAYRSPSQAQQEHINVLCQEFKLFDDAWYAPLKSELRRRGVLQTDLCVA